MRALWLTDLHIDRLSEADYETLLKKLFTSQAESIWITGDLGEPPHNWQFLEDLFCGFSEPVYFVLGNHDFYKYPIGASRAHAKSLSQAYPHAYYLTAEPGFHFGDHFILGIGGWANTGTIPLEEKTWDSDAIDDLKRLDIQGLQEKLNELAEEDANTLKFKCQAGINSSTRKVSIFTHVPPVEAMKGVYSVKPYQKNRTVFYSQALSDALQQLSKDFPSLSFDVYSGHLHQAQKYKVTDTIQGCVAESYQLDSPFKWITL